MVGIIKAVRRTRVATAVVEEMEILDLTSWVVLTAPAVAAVAAVAKRASVLPQLDSTVRRAVATQKTVATAG